jgi:hypothetical protein
MKKETLLHIFAYMIVFMWLAIIFLLHAHMNQARQMKRMEVDIDLMMKSDSLLRTHYQKCSFIERDDVKMDARGYFYSGYAREHR